MVVTGAGGFLARVITRSARVAGWKVITVGRGTANDEEYRTCAANEPSTRIAEWLAEWQPEVIFHGAGSADVRASFADPAADLQASLGSWSRWLEAARLWGAKPLMLFPSSAAVYGSPKQLPICEDAPCSPISPYGFHKHLCEQLAAEYHTLFQVPVVILRLFSVFGPTQCRLLVRELFNRLQTASPTLELLGSGHETRDYLLETDVGNAVLCAAAQADKARQSDRPLIFNLASGREINVLTLATLMRDALGDTRPIVCMGQARPGDPERWCADATRFQAAHPTWQATALEQALKSTLDAWQHEAP